MVNFGNPYKEKRADSLIPQKYLDQCPSSQRGVLSVQESTTSSPPHEAFDSVEEGEAIYVQVRKSPSRTSPRREEDESSIKKPPPPPPAVPPTTQPKTVANRGTDVIATPPPPQKPRAETTTTKPPPKPAPPPPKPGARPPPPKHAKGKAPPPPPPSKGRPCPPRRKSSVSQLVVDGELKEKGYASDDSSRTPTLPPPKAPQRQGSITQPAETTKPQPQEAANLEDADVKPNVDLPDGWISVWSKSQKRWYFFGKSATTRIQSNEGEI